MAEIVRTMADTGSIWTKGHAYSSYAPQRQNVPAQWYGTLEIDNVELSWGRLFK